MPRDRRPQPARHGKGKPLPDPDRQAELGIELVAQLEVDVLRNFNQTITLGNDPVTGAPMYAHRSVKLTYKVDCGKGAVAMSAWKMFDGSFGNGEVVWADKNWGKPVFTAANDDETREVLRSSCPTSTASR